MLRCASCGRENPDEARFCHNCGSPFDAPTPAPEVRKTVTVVFCDVTESTELGARLDPESLRRVMARYFDAMRSVLDRHGGSIEKFIGDAVVAVFGVPVLHEDDALRAVRAAAEMRRLLDELNDELDRRWGVRLAVRTGINTGEVVVGRKDMGESLILGDAVNVAARLEQVAQPGEILVGEQTYTLVRDAVVAERVEDLRVKGKVGAVPALRLLDVLPGAPGRARQLDSPMVGREHERQLLAQAYGRVVRERACHLFTILGAAGVGKSRLAREFVAEVGPDALVASGRCLPYGEGITYWPLVEALRQAADLPSDDPEAARGRIRDVLGRLEGGLDAAPVIEQLLGLADRDCATQEIFWATRRLLEALAATRPLVLAFDDIHWAEGVFLDLIEHVADWAREAPILLVSLARPELLDTRPTWGGGKMNATSVLLEPLDADESERLLAHLLADAEVDADTLTRIAAAAEGNPLFVEELVSMLVDEGLLVRGNGGWVTAAGASIRVPPTIQALLAARIDRLRDTERTVLERGSIEGRTFHRGAVESLLEEGDREPCIAALPTLMRKELIRPDHSSFSADDAFRFRHILLRDAAYQGVPKELRSELHRRLASWLSEKGELVGGELDAIVGYHLEQAFKYREELNVLDETAHELADAGAERLAAAGRRALRRGDVAAGANLLGRARDLLGARGRASVELVLELAEAVRATGDLARAGALLAEARAAAAVDPRLEAHAQIEELILRSLVEPDFRTSELLEAAEAAIALLQEAGDDRGLAKAWRGVAEVHLTSCRWAESAAALERALEHGRAADDEREVTAALPFLANALYWGPTPASQGAARCEQIVAQADGHLAVEANGLCFLAGFAAMQGDFERARELLRGSRAIFEDLGHTYGLAALALVAGPVHLLAGDAWAAERELRWSCDALEAMGETGTLSSAAAFLAEALYAQGRYEEAVTWTDTSRRMAAPDDVATEIGWRLVRARLDARASQAEAGEALAREALARTDDTDFLNMRADALLALAEVLRLSGRPGDALRPTREALELYERKENLVSAQRARALLAPVER